MERYHPNIFSECAACPRAQALSAKYPDHDLELFADSNGLSHPRFSISCTDPEKDDLEIHMVMTPWSNHDHGSLQLAFGVVNEVVCPAKLASTITLKRQQIESEQKELQKLEDLARE